jgi:hypothetical protein
MFADEIHQHAWPGFMARPFIRRPLLIACMLLTFWIDYITGPTIRFPAFYIAPVLLFAWYDGLLWGGAAAVGIILARLGMEQYIWPAVPWSLQDSLFNAGTSLTMILIIAGFTAMAGRLSREVRVLWGLLPICMYCHCIRTEKNFWEKLETYIEDRSKAHFSHGICPNCMRSLLNKERSDL